MARVAMAGFLHETGLWTKRRSVCGAKTMRKTKFWLSGMLALGVASAVNADDKLLVQVPALLDPSAPIEDSVRRECQVEARIGIHVYQEVKAGYPDAAASSDPAK